MEQHFTAKTDVGRREQFFKVVKLRGRGRPSARKLGRASLKLARKLGLTSEECTVSRYEASKKKEREVKEEGARSGGWALQGRRRNVFHPHKICTVQEIRHLIIMSRL
ncbi:hypothetical protein EAG_15532 [Camponotus floridanus]|uniref:Uncharacterized protein n=1 Tax=Camponotus floridanus TaxID=104421 RepID=E2AZL0_CAMFO|nr:hypothetical protein EAG_15532 [Camponotus floridanus]